MFTLTVRTMSGSNETPGAGAPTLAAALEVAGALLAEVDIRAGQSAWVDVHDQDGRLALEVAARRF